MSEEKKDVVVSEKPVDQDSDFADEEKPLPLPEAPKAEEAKPAEAKPAEPEVNLHKEAEPEEVKPVVAEEKPSGNPEISGKKVAKPAPVKYEYESENLAAIEKERTVFYGQYKKSNIWKYSVSGICIVIIILGYILPLQIASWTAYQMPITLSVLAVGVLGLGIFSYVSRKKIEVKMKDYFKKFYENTNAYVFSDPDIKNVTGAVENKLPAESFNAAGLYKDVVQVGSRASFQFEYKGLNCSISDAAGQTKGPKGTLQTIYVGKFIQCPSTYQGGTCIVYLKGNNRALPPTSLKDYSLIEDHKDMIVYGEEGAKRALTKKVRDAIAQFRTNDILCDAAISIKDGHAYIALGYEDTLMVLPMDKSFNPNPTAQFKNDFEKVLDLISVLNFKEHE